MKKKDTFVLPLRQNRSCSYINFPQLNHFPVSWRPTELTLHTTDRLMVSILQNKSSGNFCLFKPIEFRQIQEPYFSYCFPLKLNRISSKFSNGIQRADCEWKTLPWNTMKGIAWVVGMRMNVKKKKKMRSRNRNRVVGCDRDAIPGKNKWNKVGRPFVLGEQH